MIRTTLALAIVTLAPTAAQAVPPGALVVREDAPVAFTVEPVAGSARWRFTLRNQSATGQTLTVVADRRLISFEFPPTAPPGPARRRRATPTRCVHADRPALNEFAPRVVLEPGGTYSEAFDLRDQCALRVPTFEAGAQLAARYGWEDGRQRSRLRSVLIDESPSVLPGLTTVVTTPAPHDPRVEAPPSALLGVVATGSSALRGEGLRVAVRVVNPSAHPTWTMYRVGMWSFRVTSPDGGVTVCDRITRTPSALRDFFIRLGARGGRSASLLPSEWCPRGTFWQAGVYQVEAAFASSADGGEWDLQRVFTGRALSSPFPVRVVRGDGRYRAWDPRRAP